jgi:hypothetical protein
MKEIDKEELKYICKQSKIIGLGILFLTILLVIVILYK